MKINCTNYNINNVGEIVTLNGWVNKKRDLDNVAFAKKFILDAMVKYKKLKDDNRKYVTGFTDKFLYSKENKVILDIEEVENDK